MYKITDYSYKKARENKVLIINSTKGDYKIDIYTKDGDYITSIGNKNYKDYPTFLDEDGVEVAAKHRKRYLLRHSKDFKNKGTRGWYARTLLW